MGTLIIVISIASQSTPKLISFFIGDFISLIYSWCLIFGLIHSFYSTAQPFDTNFAQLESIHINALIFLPLAGFGAFPYILYILNFTKKSRIIRIITNSNLRIINHLAESKGEFKMWSAASYHGNMFRGLNSLDELFEYVAFKEPRSEILNSFSSLLMVYIDKKGQLPESIFKSSDILKRDISFRGLKEELEIVENNRTFYEFKTLHILNDIYLRLIKKDEYQLASQCGKEISDCGKKAIEVGQDQSINIFFISLNTLLRFSLKHGLRKGELRNTYNLLFHYSELVLALIKHKKTDNLIKQSKHLCYYAGEITHYVNGKPSFAFLVDIICLEFNKILQSICQAGLDHDVHMKVLEQYLMIGPSDKLLNENIGLARQMIDTSSLLKVNLALYYISSGHNILVERILTDIRIDFDKVGIEDPKHHLFDICDQIQQTDREFWESTDRGNQNIYYSPFKGYMNEFIELAEKHFASLK